MLRVRFFVLAVGVLALGVLAGAQIVFTPTGQTRDAPPRPTERQMPVGTSSISGTVVAADSGKPVKGARVMVSGSVTIAAAATLPGERRGVAGAPAVGGVPTVGVTLPTRGGGVTQITSGPVSPGFVSRTVFTDSSGQFSFPRLPAGNFTISVSQNQFLQTNYGERRTGAPGKTLILAEGQQMNLKVPMTRGGVISGVVRGLDGEPQDRAQVQAWRFDMSSGFRRLQSEGYAQTDDRGVYRMFGLRPGEYVVSATPNMSMAMMMDRNASQADEIERAITTGRINPPAAAGYPPTVSVPIAPPPTPEQQMMGPTSYLPTYAPSAMAPSGATTVKVAGGEEQPGIDILVRLTQSTNIQGTVSTPLDAGVAVQLSLVSEDTSIDSPQTNSARTDANGKFTFRSVAPGKYTVFAQTVAAPQFIQIAPGQMATPQPPPVLTDAQRLWGKAQVTISGEPMISVDVQLQAARTLSGIVVFEMQRPPDLTRTKMTVSVSAAPSRQPIFFGSTPQAQVGPDGRFTVTGMAPGRYVIRCSNGFLKSSIVNGQDTLDFPLEFTGEQDIAGAVLTVTDAPGELSGSLTDSAGRPASDYSIIVAASDSRYWTPGSRRIVLARPSADGRYTLRGLPSGSYLVAAVSDIEQGGQYDPEFLKSLAAAAVPVTIVEGGKVQQDLRIK